MISFSILFGSLSARYRNRWPDTIIRVLSYTGIAIPAFIMAVLLLLVFGYYWKVIPVIGRLSYGYSAPPRITGMYVFDSLLARDFSTAWNALLHLFLPAVSLAIAGIFQEARIIRTAISDNMNKDYVTAVTGYGVPQKIVFFKYLLKPSMIPAVSVMGMDIASLMTNAFLVEVIFTWPGISRYGMNAMMGKDLNAISAVIILFGLMFVMINIIVDIIVSYLDPRIRLGGGI
jgi:peptide/nickel transport system permease protein